MVRSSIVTVVPWTLRMRASSPYSLLPEFCEPSIEVESTPVPSSVIDWVMSMSVPWVRS